MKKRNRSAKLLLLILTALLIALALPVSASAAKKEKLLKTAKTYQDGKLVSSTTNTYNKKGFLTKANYYYKDINGKDINSTFKSKWTMWSKGSSIPKKRVDTETDWKCVYNFDKKGLITKSTATYGNGSKEIVTYKYKGKKLVSSVEKDGAGNILSKATYDKYGNTKTYTAYKDGKVEYSMTYKNTYKKGVLRKRVLTFDDGNSLVTIYDSKGNKTSTVSKDKNGKAYSSSSYKNTYKGKYLTKVIHTETSYYNNKTTTETIKYTYTSKKYPVYE